MNTYLNMFIDEADKEFWMMAKEHFLQTPPQVYMGIIALVVTYIFEIKFMRKHGWKDRKPKRVQKAEKLGHIVRGERVGDGSYFEDVGEVSEKKYWRANYVYEVGGKTYTYSYRGGAYPPETLTLYYISNPRRVFHNMRGSLLNFIHAAIYTLFPWVVAICVIQLLGGV